MFLLCLIGCILICIIETVDGYTQLSRNLTTYVGTVKRYNLIEHTPIVLPEISQCLLRDVAIKEGIDCLNEFQGALFDELSNNNDALIHSQTASGKTFSILLYAVLRYYFNIKKESLTSENVNRLIGEVKKVKVDIRLNQLFTPKDVKRALILCPTKELAVQSHEQFLRLGKEGSFYENETYDSEKIFIVGSSNQVESYFINNDEKHVRSLLQSIDFLVLDEIDRLFKVPNQYASLKRKELYNEKPGSSYNICQTLLSISPKKLQIAGGSASITRQHIRKLNQIIRLYRSNNYNSLAIIRRKDVSTDTMRYVGIPSTIEHFYKRSETDKLESKVEALMDIYNRADASIVFVSSNHSILSFKHYMGKYDVECKILHHEFGICDNISKRFDEECDKYSYKRRPSMTLNMYSKVANDDTKSLLVASTDSARGLHLPKLDTVYIIGKPRNINEYIHISGRVGRGLKSGKCITIDSSDNLEVLSSWQKQLNTNLNPLKEPNKGRIGVFATILAIGITLYSSARGGTEMAVKEVAG